MEPIQKGKQTNKTSNMCASDKGKQTNKQAEAAHAEAQMQGGVQSCITCGVQYAMHQSMWKSFGDASEMHQKSTQFDMQGHTLTWGLAILPSQQALPNSNSSASPTQIEPTDIQAMRGKFFTRPHTWPSGVSAG